MLIWINSLIYINVLEASQINFDPISLTSVLNKGYIEPVAIEMGQGFEIFNFLYKLT